MSKEWPTGKKRVKFISLVVCGEVFSGTATPSASGIGFFLFPPIFDVFIFYAAPCSLLLFIGFCLGACCCAAIRDVDAKPKKKGTASLSRH